MRWECGSALGVGKLLATTARADIYEWRDPSGARHFTNNKDAVPEEYRAAARTLIAGWERPPVAEPAPAPAPPAQPEMVSDAVSEAYLAGLRTALELSG